MVRAPSVPGRRNGSKSAGTSSARAGRQLSLEVTLNV